MRKWIVAAALLVAASAGAQTPQPGPTPEMNAALGGYYKCVHDYSQSLAATKETPDDIAQAALSRCYMARETIRATVKAAGPNLSDELVNEGMVQIEHNAVNFAKETVLETRYPAKVSPHVN